MLRPIRCAIFAATLIHAPFSLADVVLDGRSATPEIIAGIADGEAVSIAPLAMKRVEAAHTVLLEAAQAGQQIYGLTTGVGENKDRSMVDAKGKLTQEIIDASGRFNVGLIHAHSGSVGPDMDVRTARAAMAARLNAMLDGGAGVQTSIVDTYVQFLNRGVTPAMPSDGSLGEADITILSHVGLAMLGEGDVYYQGRKIPAAEALNASGIKPIKPYGKDALAILSSNAYSAGMAALALNDMGRLLKVSKLVYALSLQAFNGNVSPFLQDTLALRPFPYTVRAGEELRTLLAGSSIWNRDDKRALQDPLSYRDGVYLLGEEERAYAGTQALLSIQLNSSDDNPGVAVGVKAHSTRWQDRRGYVDANGVTGAVLPSANFEPLPWVLSFEELGLVLGHNSLASAQRIMKLNDPQRSGLPRFLGTEQTVHAFGAMEKPPVALAEANKALAMPVSMDYLPVAGDIEDIATNAPSVVERVQQQIDNSYTLLGIELIHAGQAVDLRKQQQPDFTLSPATAGLYTALRGKVAFLDRDRPLTPDFRAAAALLHAYPG
jgi:histidine ammonia-lyase